MGNLSDTWRQEPVGRRILYITVGVVLILLVVASLVGWFWPKGTTVDTKPTRPGSSATEQTEPGAEDETKEEGRVSVGEYSFKVDENGMVEMPVTTDPAEAAAGAAAVAFNFDASKLTRQQFFDIAIDRMTKPSADYVGPVGEVDTAWIFNVGRQTWTNNFLRDDDVFQRSVEPSEVLHAIVNGCGATNADQPEQCTWWVPANGSTFEGLERINAVWAGVPNLVLSEDELRAWDATATPKVNADVNLTPSTEGATYTRWWVLSNVNHTFPDDGGAGGAKWAEYQGAKFFIWCDAPKDGGLCGVANLGSSTGAADFPKLWPKD